MSLYIEEIKKDPIIRKFSLYGLLKNLKFFEPYLIIYLLSFNISLLNIGFLYSIREIIIYIFEVPSGIIADHYGKKNELMMCFLFYIASFLLFFIGSSFYLFTIAMIFYGLGEAFRSGTHKSMILTYLEKKNWFSYKTFVYGRTRSYSLIGSSISSFLSIILIIALPATRWIFLITTLPYIADFLLILSYPDDLNEKQVTQIRVVDFIKLSKDNLIDIFKQKFLLKIVLSSSTYDGIFKTIKDYIQPILLVLIAVESEKTVKVILGILYGLFFLFSSLASRNVYKLRNIFDASKLMNYSFLIQSIGLLFIALSIQLKNIPMGIAMFFILYVIKDARRPIFVDFSSDYMTKTQRATVLSIESQVRSFFIIIMAPFIGYISDNLGISTAFLILSLLAFFLTAILKFKTS